MNFATIDNVPLTEREENHAQPTIQLFVSAPEGYSEARSLSQAVKSGGFTQLVFECPDGLGPRPARLDPADCICLIEIQRISITSLNSDRLLWTADSGAAIRALQTSDSLTAVSHSDAALFVSTSGDPQVILPLVDGQDSPVRVGILLRIQTSVEAVMEAVRTSAHKEIEALKGSLAAAEMTMRELRSEIRASQAERTLIAAELRDAIMERNAARRELKAIEEDAEVARSRQLEMESRLEELETIEKSLEAERRIRADLERSLSWRVTRPLRRLNSLLRR